MSIQGALTDLMKVFLAFYIGCCFVGRRDIALKVIAHERAKALKGASGQGWGCPSIFHRTGDCMTYDPANYKTK